MKERLFSMRMVIYVSLTILLLSGITYMGRGISISGLVDFNSFDLLMSQISNTFIVLSLTVVLSTNVGCVYWIDIKDHKLVEPMFSCFIAIMTYLLSNLGFSIVSYLLGEKHSLLISFLVSIILLMWLSYKMISVYFGRSRMKRKLMLEYMRNKWMVDLCEIGRGEDEEENAHAIQSYANHFKRIQNDKWFSRQFDKFCKKWSKIASQEELLRLAEVSGKKLEAYEEGIRENSIRALNEGNKDIIEENIQLLAPMDSNQSVLRLLSEIDVTNPGYAANLLYQLCMEGSYNPSIEEVRIYAKTLMEQLIEGGCAPESIYNMAKLLGGLGGKEDYLEMLHKETLIEDISQIEKDIKEKIIPLYDNVIGMSCYKLVDELCGAYEAHNKTEFDKYLGNLIWIKNKLEQEINAASIEIVSRVKKYPLMMRRIQFFSDAEKVRLEPIFEKENPELLEQLSDMNIYVFMDNYIISNMEELIEAQSKYEKLRSIFGEKNPAVLRERTRLALAYNEARDYQSTCNLYETNKAEIVGDETEADVSNSAKALALIRCGYSGEAWNIAYALYNKYKPEQHHSVGNERLEIVYQNASDVFYYLGRYEWSVAFDECILLSHYEYDKPAVLAYYRMVVGSDEWNQDNGENVLRFSYVNKITEKEWEEAYIRCRMVLGEENNTTLKAKANYITNRKNISDEERLAQLRAIYLRHVELFGENHPDTVDVRLRLANRLADENIQHYRGVYSIRKHVLGELHPNTINMLFRCWDIYLKQKNDLMAQLYEHKVEEIENGIELVNNQMALMRINALINGYRIMDNQQKIIELYQRLYQKQKEVYGEKATILVDTMNNIAYQYAQAKAYKKVVEYFEYAYEEAYKIRDLEQMCQAKRMSGLYRVKQQFSKDTTTNGYELIQRYFEKRLEKKNLSEEQRLLERVDFLAIKGKEQWFYEDVRMEGAEIYNKLIALPGDYVKETLLTLYSIKCAYEREKEMEYVELLQKEIDEILETLDNL